jgi:hypothetical protein
MELLTDQWWLWLWNTYSISIGILAALLKAWAVLHPGAENNKIMELLSLAFKKPGA